MDGTNGASPGVTVRADTEETLRLLLRLDVEDATHVRESTRGRSRRLRQTGPSADHGAE